MPTYVYACDSCGKQFEKFQSFKEDPLKVCICGQEGNVRRVIQPAGIVFKGSGWYLTDSRGGGTATVSSDASSKDGKGDKTDASVSPADSAASPAGPAPAAPASPAPAAPAKPASPASSNE
jgi:putative FmdB family regulatory protein